MALQEWKAGDIITAERLNEINNIISSLYPEVTVGPSSVVSVNDAVPLVPNALTINLPSVQDLHGYNAPWPGGAAPGCVFGREASVSGTTVTYENLSLPQGSYTIWAQSDTRVRQRGEAYVDITTAESTSTLRLTFVASSDETPVLTTIISNSTITSISIGGAPSMSKIKIMVITGEIADENIPPWENICPFTAWTGASVHHGASVDDPDAQTYTFTFPTSAGTVYSGTLDAPTGTLTVTHMLITFNGIEENQGLVDLGDCLRAGITYVKADGSTSITNTQLNLFSSGTQNAVASWLPQTVQSYGRNEAGFYMYGTHAFYVKFPKPAFSSKEDINAYLAQHPLHIVVGDLNDPPTYQLTPEQITMLIGTNTLWSNTGEITLTYQVNPYDKLLELIRSYHPETTPLQSVSLLNTSAENEETTSEEET